MQEIKFRAWEKKSKTMFPVVKLIYDLIVENLREVALFDTDKLNTFYRGIKGVTLMHSSGLKDMYNVEIYEGDILSTEKYHGYTKYAVWYYKGSFRVDHTTSGGYIPEHWNANVQYHKIVGNIYENPELLDNKD